MSLFIPSQLSRRDLLVKGTKLSLAGVGVLAGLTTGVAAGEGSALVSQDIDVLNEILGTEHEGIAVYQGCIEHKLLAKATLKTARLFQDHHKKHRDILIEKISSLGGTPAVAKTDAAYQSDLDFAVLKSQQEALHMIMKLEIGAANAYIGMLPSTNDHELVKVAGRIAADEVVHWTTLSAMLHLPLPTQALSFGT